MWRDASCNQKIFFDALFKAASEALIELAANPRHLDGNIGMTGVLHTNNRRLDIHPHIHFIAPAGALNKKRNCGRKKVENPFFLASLYPCYLKVNFLPFSKKKMLVSLKKFIRYALFIILLERIVCHR